MGYRLPDEPLQHCEAHAVACCGRRRCGPKRGVAAAKGSERLRDRGPAEYPLADETA